MIQAKCIQKFKDKQGKIYGYRLEDTKGDTIDVKAEVLKLAMLNKQIDIINLTLTSDGRLISKKENNKLQSKYIRLRHIGIDALNTLSKLGFKKEDMRLEYEVAYKFKGGNTDYEFYKIDFSKPSNEDPILKYPELYSPSEYSNDACEILDANIVICVGNEYEYILTISIHENNDKTYNIYEGPMGSGQIYIDARYNLKINEVMEHIKKCIIRNKQ